MSDADATASTPDVDELRAEDVERAESIRDGLRDDALPAEGVPLAQSIRAVRLGQGANCSSVGSVIDTLFVTAAIGGAVFAAIAAAMTREQVRVTGRKRPAAHGIEGDAHAGPKRDTAPEEDR